MVLTRAARQECRWDGRFTITTVSLANLGLADYVEPMSEYLRLYRVNVNQQAVAPPAPPTSPAPMVPTVQEETAVPRHRHHRRQISCCSWACHPCQTSQSWAEEHPRWSLCRHVLLLMKTSEVNYPACSQQLFFFDNSSQQLFFFDNSSQQLWVGLLS